MSTKTTACIALFALALTGCSGMTSRDRDTVTGAAIGGAAGAVLTGGSALGTAGGAAVGGIIGNQLEKHRR